MGIKPTLDSVKRGASDSTYSVCIEIYYYEIPKRKQESQYDNARGILPGRFWSGEFPHGGFCRVTAKTLGGFVCAGSSGGWQSKEGGENLPIARFSITIFGPHPAGAI